VRIQAGRLRRSLERYYLLAGKDDAIRIELPKGTYVPTFRKVPVGDPVDVALEPQALPSLAFPDPTPVPASADGWPTLAVVRFEVTAPAPDLLDLPVLIEEKLTAELGRYKDVRITVRSDANEAAPPSGPATRFQLLGRVRPGEEGITVSARLLDRTTGEQLWGDEYQTIAKPELWSGDASGVAHVIAARVAGENGIITQALTGEYRRGTHPAGDPYAAILASYHFFFKRDLQDFAPAVSGLQAAVAREPEVGLAWTQLARIYQANYVFELSDMATPIDEAIAYAYQGVRLHPLNARTRCVLASALLAKGELQAGRDALEPALRLNPGSLVYLEIIGYLQALLGDWDGGIALVRRAMALNPHHLPHVSVSLWADHLRRGEFEPAYQVALEYRDPAFFWRSLMRASSLGHLGRIDEARAQVAELLREKPTFASRGRFFIGCFITPDDLQEKVVEGLRKAGLTLV
jgi:tetratricopeptide (TPR) repeat protein